jgi:two-component system, cell cycle sensor histidine kinase and response regulator CckA
MTSEGGAVSPGDPSTGLEEALADNASLRRHASSVAHDFNNLLSVITGYTEMMLRRLRPDDPLRRNAEAIKRATEWGAALAQQILAGSRRPPAAPTPVDLNQLVGNVTRVLQPLLGESIELVTRLDSGLGLVSANPHQIGQVIMNLVVNARDAMPQGGQLTIETANVSQVVMLAVSDTGCGMDNETRARLFEPYFTTKEPGRGTGVGLATVYDVVTHLGGQISVMSDAGAGSTFKIYLPRVPETAPTAEAPATPSGVGAPADGKTVLVVENEREVRDLIREILQLQSYVVLEASDRDEALALSSQHAGRIDLMVVDVGVPPSFADEWVARVRVTRPEVRVLYVSGYLAESGSIDAPKLGLLLQKPFTVGAFTKAIGMVMARAK